MQIGDIYFDLVHNSCPEQYDVYRDQDLIGYVRLRHGVLSVYSLKERVHRFTFDEPFKGSFSSDEERKKYLTDLVQYLPL